MHRFYEEDGKFSATTGSLFQSAYAACELFFPFKRIFCMGSHASLNLPHTPASARGLERMRAEAHTGRVRRARQIESAFWAVRCVAAGAD